MDTYSNELKAPSTKTAPAAGTRRDRRVLVTVFGTALLLTLDAANTRSQLAIASESVNLESPLSTESAKADDTGRPTRLAPVLHMVDDQGVALADSLEHDTGHSWTTPVVSPARSSVILAQATQPVPGVPPPTADTGATDTAAPSLFDQIETAVFGPNFSTGLGFVLGIATDAGSLLKMQTATTLERRNPNVNEPVLMGRRLGQLAANGSYWFPARQDLDTVLSKIDSDLVSRIVTVKGPYAARYGPGFSFYDVELLDAPRYECGFESHGRSKLEYQSNGEQWHARQSLWGGSYDWGFRIGYGHRGGIDYETGDGSTQPGGYKSHVSDLTLGFDLTENDHLNFNYLRLDQTDVEFAGQFYDINFLVTDGYEVKYVRENGAFVDRLETEGWYNQTRFGGDADQKQAIVDFAGGNFQSSVDVRASSAGYRTAATWGVPNHASVTAGSDLRFLKQRLSERTLEPNNLMNPIFDTIIPPAESSNPGLFLESVLPITSRLSVKSGARVDWVSTSAQRTVDLIQLPDADMQALLGGPLDRDFSLWSVYLTGEYSLAPGITLNGGFARAMRAPTMTELYSYAPFIAVLPQTAFTNLYGNPNLSQERLWQLDLGIEGQYDCWRFGINGFYAWVEDYITLDFLDPPGGVSYGYVNTDRATLSGGDVFGELDWTDNVTIFGSMTYVEGRDHTRSLNVSPQRLISTSGVPFSTTRSLNSTRKEPLPAIAPIASQIGMRIQSAEEQPRWSIELLARVVDSQDRIASILREQPTAGFATYHVNAYWQARDNLVFTAGVDNLTDKFYLEHFDSRLGLSTPVYQIGQNYYVGCELTY